jgi:hypothetical protein
MKMSSCLDVIRVAIALTGMAGLGVQAHAQTRLPVPNFSITRHPLLYFNLWPGDFNEDGRTDLVAAARGSGGQPADLLVSIGRGDGTFRPPAPLGLTGWPVTVSDFNGDGLADVVIRRSNSLEILPGNGDATFDAPIVVDTVDPFIEIRPWALVADFNGDTRRDIVVSVAEVGLQAYPGNGDFTFGSPASLQIPDFLGRDGISGDFNGDGRRDLVVVGCCQISVFINQGGLSFTRADIGAGADYTDITTGDLNADGRLDLIASAWTLESFYSYQNPGTVYVLLGNGDGTFRERVAYDTGVRGEISVVAGDFNRDGRLDVATGNRSLHNDGEIGFQLWDSVSIMRGDGTGRLLPGASYSLGTANQVFDSVDPLYPGGFPGAHHQLNTSDVNGDGQTDLIASPTIVMLNRAAAPNRPPTVFAGPDQTVFTAPDFDFVLRGEASDPDGHWLTYTWRDESGRVIGTTPWVRIRLEGGITKTYTLSVDDGLGGTANDSVTVRAPAPDFFMAIASFRESITAGSPFEIRWELTENPEIDGFALSYSLDDGRTFTTVPGCGDLGPDVRQCTWPDPGPPSEHARLRLIAGGASGDWIVVTNRFQITRDALAPGWSSADVGAVGAAGASSESDGTWTIEGSGADIFGTADEFHYAFRSAGDFTFTARVASIENLHRWVKAGIMVRENLSPGSRHASLFATPRTERGIAFQWREHLNGTSGHTSGPAIAPPVWLRVGRVGNMVSAYYRTSESDLWTLVGRQTFTALSGSVYVGLAVSSHVDGLLATAKFDHVTLERHAINTTSDIGDVGVEGSVTFDGVVHELQGSGADIWGVTDAFRFAYSHNFYSSGSIAEITARVRSIEPTHRWAKAGVMFRDFDLAPDAKHVMVIVSPGRGVAMQYRSVTGGPSAQVGIRAGTAPQWVRLTRTGSNQYTGYTSEDGITWQTLGSVIIDMFPEVGLAVTSHNNATLATGAFEDVAVRQFQSGVSSSAVNTSQSGTR